MHPRNERTPQCKQGAGPSRAVDEKDGIQPRARLIPALTIPAVEAMRVIRPTMVKSIETERMRLRAAAHDVKGDLERAITHLNQERDHLKFISRKVAEKTDKLDRAVEEHAKAHDMLVATKSNDNSAPNSEGKELGPGKNPMIKICENIVRTCSENVEKSHRSLSRMEFKRKRQAVIVDKAKEEVQESEKAKRDNAAQIENETFQMVALSEFVKDL